MLQHLLQHNRTPEQLHGLFQANLEMAEALSGGEREPIVEEEGESSLVDKAAKLTLQPREVSPKTEPDVVNTPQSPVARSVQKASDVTSEARPTEMRPGVPWPSPGTQSGSMIKRFVDSDPRAYSVYQATAEDTDKAGPTRYRVALGNDHYVCFPKPRPAEQLAKIARAHGVRHPMVAGRVYSWPEGSTPYPIDPSRVRDGATHRDPESTKPEW